MAVQPQKLRTLYVMKIMLERTDEEHLLTAPEICAILKTEYSLDTDRKTVYSELDTLENFGMDIVKKRGRRPGYCVGQRTFELPELKLLVDAVQSSKFITEKKSGELIEKLESQCSHHEAEQLQRQVFIYNRIKTENETIYYNVDQIHTSIYQNRKVRYQYCEWNSRKELVLRRGGIFYEISPWALLWDDENYYMVGYDEKSSRIKHYRVDKIRCLSIMEEERQGREYFENFDLAAFSKKTFGMFGGTDQLVTLRGHNSLAGVVIDRFGQNTWMIPCDEEHFQAHVAVAVSPQFFGWVTGIGTKLEITGPESVREKYVAYLEETLKMYHNEVLPERLSR